MVAEVSRQVQARYDAMLERLRPRIGLMMRRGAQQPLQPPWRPPKPHQWVIGTIQIDEESVLVTTSEGLDPGTVRAILERGFVLMTRHGATEDGATVSVYVQLKRWTVLLTRVRTPRS